MKRFLKRALGVIGAILLLAIVVFAIGVLWPLDEVEPVRTTTTVAIVNVSIIDVSAGAVVPHQVVVIENGRITAAGGEVAIPPGAQVIGGGGRYLMPAMWDMHAHIYAIAPMLDLPLHIAYGVTNVRDMQGCPQPNDPFIACSSDKRRWTDEAIAGKRVAPRVAGMTSFMANGPGMLARLKNAPRSFGTATADDGRQFARHFAGEADAIKVYDRVTRDAYFAIVEEARKRKMDVVGHRPYAVSAIEAAAHQKSIEHARFLLHESFPGAAALRAQAGTPLWREDRRRMLDEHDPQMAAAIFDAMRRNGTWYVPTHLTRWVDAYGETPAVRKDPLLRYLHPLMERQWLEDVDETLARDPSPQARATYREFYRKGLELTGQAHRAGVKVLAGTDYIVAGADLHRELEQLVAAGLPPAAALRAATLHPAEYFRATDRYGSVAAGKVADLVLLEANPLADIRNTRKIAAVIFNGNVYDSDALVRIHRHVEGQARSWTVACKIVWRFVRNPVAY